MSLPNSLPLSIVNLNYDCLFQIFSHLKLSDLLNFRLQCSSLNDAVCKFFPHLDSLSIVYTEVLTEYHTFVLVDPRSRKRPIISGLPGHYEPAPIIKLTQSSDLKIPKSVDYWIDDTCKDIYQPRYRREDFMIIQGEENFEKFSKFIKKYEIRNIKKLALIVDSPPCKIEYRLLAMMTELLELCSKVETLFLDRTNREGQSDYRPTNITIMKAEAERFLATIVGLASLNELHFFARQKSYFVFSYFYTQTNSHEDRATNLTKIGNFLSAMFKKLRIFNYNNGHFSNQPIMSYLTPLLGQTFEDIFEVSLRVNDFEQLINSGTKFANLRSLVLFEYYPFYAFDSLGIGNSLGQLRCFHFDGYLRLRKEIMDDLNALPKLEKLSAELIEVWGEENNLPEVINHTIKHIEVKKVYQNRWYTFTSFFQVLLTVTVSEPEVVVYDRNTLNKISIEN